MASSVASIRLSGFHRAPHPHPTIRPRTTIEGPSPDTAWSVFWEIGDLVQLAKKGWIAIRGLSGRRVDYIGDRLISQALSVVATIVIGKANIL